MQKLTEDQKKIIRYRLLAELRNEAAALELCIVRQCTAAGMSADEIEAGLKRCWLRMQNLAEEGFTFDQAKEIILKEEDAER
jgi:hypothetical protein